MDTQRLTCRNYTSIHFYSLHHSKGFKSHNNNNTYIITNDYRKSDMGRRSGVYTDMSITPTQASILLWNDSISNDPFQKAISSILHLCNLNCMYASMYLHVCVCVYVFRCIYTSTVQYLCTYGRHTLGRGSGCEYILAARSLNTIICSSKRGSVLSS